MTCLDELEIDMGDSNDDWYAVCTACLLYTSQHAFLGASKYHWINYDETKVADAYSKFLATQRGTVLHDFACQCITLGQKLPKSQKTLNIDVYKRQTVIERMCNKDES